MGRKKEARRGVEKARNREEFEYPCPVFGLGESGMS